MGERPLVDSPDFRRGRVPDWDIAVERDVALAAMALHAYDLSGEMAQLIPAVPVAWDPSGAPGYLSDVVPLEDGLLEDDGRVQSFRTSYEPAFDAGDTGFFAFQNEVSLHNDPEAASSYVEEQLSLLETAMIDMDLEETGRTETAYGPRLVFEGSDFSVGVWVGSIAELTSTVVIAGDDAEAIEVALGNAVTKSTERIEGIRSGRLGYGPLPDLAEFVDTARWMVKAKGPAIQVSFDGSYATGQGSECTVQFGPINLSVTVATDGRALVGTGPSDDVNEVVPTGAFEEIATCGRVAPYLPSYFSNAENRGPDGFLRHLPDLGSVPAFTSEFGDGQAVRYDLTDVYQRYLTEASGIEVAEMTLWLHAGDGWPLGYKVLLRGDGDSLDQLGVLPGLPPGQAEVVIELQVLEVDGGLSIPAVPGSLPAPPAGVAIVFSAASADGAFDIYEMAPSGDLRVLSHHPNADVTPAVSPDGQTVVFMSHRSGNESLYFVDIDGNRPRRLTAPFTDGGDAWPSWSPDGNLVVFASDRPTSEGSFVVGIHDLWAIDADGSDLRWIFGTEGDETEPAWSPTDDVIVFLSDADTVLGSDVYTVRSDGTGLTRLTDNAGYKHPTWSPDGKKILVSRVVDGQDALVLLDLSGGDPVQVDTGGTPATAGFFTPDGQHLVFTDGARLWTIGVDGGGLTALTSIPLTQVGPPSITVVAGR